MCFACVLSIFGGILSVCGCVLVVFEYFYGGLMCLGVFREKTVLSVFNVFCVF